MNTSVVAVPVSVALSDIGAPGAVLGKGGEAVVHELPGYTAPDRTGPLVYKAYRKPHEDPARLTRIVRLRGQLAPARRAVLDRLAAWPCRVVEDGGDVVGLVLPRIPDEFIADIRSPTGNALRNAREVQYLFLDPARAASMGHATPTGEQRLSVCRDLATALAFLHDELDVAFGDLNHANELYRLEPRTGVHLIDCDGVRPRGTVTLHKQLNTPDWVPPEGGVLSPETDRYKLGLFVLRCLAPGPFASGAVDPARAAGVLDAAGMDLLRRAVGPVPGDRPEAVEWRRYLNAVLGDYDDPPKITEARPARPFVLRGQPVEVLWKAERATEVEVRAGGRTLKYDGRAGSGRAVVDLDGPGFVQVYARNDLGEDFALVGPVTVVEPPSQAAMPVLLPPVVFPDLAALLPALALPAPPTVSIPAPPVPVTGAPARRGVPRLAVDLAPPFAVEDVVGSGPAFTFSRTTPATRPIPAEEAP